MLAAVWKVHRESCVKIWEALWRVHREDMYREFMGGPMKVPYREHLRAPMEVPPETSVQNFWEAIWTA
jgi:hypothetical protein